MLDTARCFSYIVLCSTIASRRICAFNNSFEPIRKTTLQAAGFGVWWWNGHTLKEPFEGRASRRRVAMAERGREPRSTGGLRPLQFGLYTRFASGSSMSKGSDMSSVQSSSGMAQLAQSIVC
jgi:hypothetical protein